MKGSENNDTLKLYLQPTTFNAADICAPHCEANPEASVHECEQHTCCSYFSMPDLATRWRFVYVRKNETAI